MAKQPKPIPQERLAYNISEFCQLVGISRPYFYALPENQKPPMVKRGGRYFISADSARAWANEGVAA